MTQTEPRFKPGKGFSYVELSNGIFTADGVWFHTSGSLLETYAPGVLASRGLKNLLRDATSWTKLPVTAASLSVPALLLALPVIQALVLALLIYLLMAILTPSVVIPAVIPPVRILSHPVVQGLLYVGVLSYLARIGHIDAVWAGLVAFLLLRWGVVEKTMQPIVTRVPGVRSRLAIPDQILRSLLVRLSLAAGGRTPELEEMENEMIRIMHSRKGKR